MEMKNDKTFRHTHTHTETPCSSHKVSASKVMQRTLAERGDNGISE